MSSVSSQSSLLPRSPHTGALGLATATFDTILVLLEPRRSDSLILVFCPFLSLVCLITLYFNSILLIYPKIFMSFNKMVTAHRVWKEGTHTEKRLSWGRVGSVVFKCAPSITILYLYLYFLSIIVSTSGQNLDQ